VRLSARTFDVVYALVQVGAARPGGGASVTPGALGAWATRVARANRLAGQILAEVPPHVDRDPADLEDLLAEGEALLAELGYPLP
jgi:hypothetical protein